ncbi:endonuclease domain-containing protein [soil metagenome]
MSNDARRRINPATLDKARDLRQSTAPAEHKLWHRLRGRSLDGLKFRRQTPIGPFIADFVCQEMKLVIELDGPSHNERGVYDDARTDYLQQQGYRVIRFLNEDVHANIDAVLKTILRECGRPPR